MNKLLSYGVCVITVLT